MNNVAIIGRPNVGKSALFNRLAKRRIAIVHDQPGITRDRISAEVEANGKTFTLWDTGGIAGTGETELSAEVRSAAERAIAQSTLILFLVDAQDGLNPMDKELARFLRKMGKPVFLVVNKIDDPKHENLASEFAALGFENIFSISAAHGRGTTKLSEAIAQSLPSTDSSQPLNLSTAQPLRIAIVGRPNAGKSSLVNALLGDRRAIVSELPGTTRDAFDITYERDHQHYVFIDTAGIRARSKHSSSVEVFSVMRAEKTITRADLCLLVIDLTEGVRAQDRHIAGLIQKARKPCITVLNKWDMIRGIPSGAEGSRGSRRKGSATGSLGSARDDGKKIEKLVATARAELFFIDYAPVLVTSALTGQHSERIFRLISKVQRAARIHIGTGKLNRVLQSAFASNPPPMVSGLRLKLLYAAQSSSNEKSELSPPEFVLFVNSPRLLTQPFARFLETKIRAVEPYPGLPILLTLRARKSHS
jgi:GTPase